MKNAQTEQLKVDGYVSTLIENHAKKLGVDIDPQNPTRESRLELALKMDEAGIDPWQGMEIMVGSRVGSEDMVRGMVVMSYKMGHMDKIRFYDGF